jgi:hypothetical protein
MDDYWPGTRPPRGRRMLATLRGRARCIGATRILALGLIAEGAWALYGSLWLGLGSHTPAADAAALPWAAVAGVMAGLIAGTCWLASDSPKA